MKLIQYFLIFVVFGLILTGISSNQIPLAYSSIDIARRKGVNVSPQILLPRIYIPTIPKSKDYLEHYSPDNYCTLSELKEFTLRDINECFKIKEKWMHLNQ
tara:strand:+ start:814 stop:1116 length:303 start_codon:yes stop_codon:yes gene_type:complete